MNRINKDNFADYILEYCNGCDFDETAYCRLSCPVYKAAIYVNTYTDDEIENEEQIEE